MSTQNQQTYDVIVIGAGVAGENAADRAARTGLSVVIVEAELVGGACSYWACIPSKVLLRPGAVLAAARAVPGVAQSITRPIDPEAVLARRDYFTSCWDDSGQVAWLASAGIALIRGRARFTGPRHVEVTSDGGTTSVTARHAVIVATGSDPVVPDVEGLREVNPWTSREATSVKNIPRSLVILGGGVVGVEMATAFADLGSRVTVVVRGRQVLTFAEEFASEAVAHSLADLGVDIRLNTAVKSVEQHDDGLRLHIGGSAGKSTKISAEKVLVALGRTAATANLGLASIGLTPGKPLLVNDSLEVAGVDGGWLFAAGDVTGRVATTHQGKYEARVVAARFGDSSEDEKNAPDWSRFRATADHEAVPQVIFTRPEVASVGLTEKAAQDAGYEVRVFSYDLGSVSGAQLTADGYSGRAQIVIDSQRQVLLGATFVGPDAAEMLHAATVAVVGQVPLDRLWHAVPAFPTVSEVWLRLLESAGL
jgi:pyruvate/2-oxoglutarate dehydrogenase complex dihydrolipoamide dehydrogenase (E3) component